MATRFIDISDNKKLASSSPIAMGVFLLLFIVISLLIRSIVSQILLWMLSFIFAQLFFQYSKRFILLTLKFVLNDKQVMSPCFEDENYVPNEKLIPSIQKILPRDTD